MGKVTYTIEIVKDDTGRIVAAVSTRTEGWLTSAVDHGVSLLVHGTLESNQHRISMDELPDDSESSAVGMIAQYLELNEAADDKIG